MEIIKKIEDEYLEWRENVLNKSKEEIYKLAYEIKIFKMFCRLENNKDKGK